MPELSIEPTEFEAPVVAAILAEWTDELTRTVPGFSSWRIVTFGPSEFRSPNGAFLLARRGADALGCVGLRRLTADTGEVKRLFVRAQARAAGVGGALLEAAEARARELGFEALRLDTTGGEPAALRLFGSAGYRPIGKYNDNPYARHWFEKRL